MATFTRQQILNFLTDKSAEAWRGTANPTEASTRFILLRLIKILVEKDIVTETDVNAAFPEFP